MTSESMCSFPRIFRETGMEMFNRNGENSNRSSNLPNDTGTSMIKNAVPEATGDSGFGIIKKWENSRKRTTTNPFAMVGKKNIISDNPDVQDLCSKLERLIFKETSTFYNIGSLERYIELDITPRGLRSIKNPSTPFDLTNEVEVKFHERWIAAAHRCSLEWVSILIERDNMKKDKLVVETKQVCEQLVNITSNSTLENFLSGINTKLNSYEKDLVERKKSKLTRDIRDYDHKRAFVFPSYQRNRRKSVSFQKGNPASEKYASKNFLSGESGASSWEEDDRETFPRLPVAANPEAFNKTYSESNGHYTNTRKRGWNNPERQRDSGDGQHKKGYGQDLSAFGQGFSELTPAATSYGAPSAPAAGGPATGGSGFGRGQNHNVQGFHPYRR